MILRRATRIMPPKVLIVDDEVLMHLLYKSHIEKAGYQMISAKSGEEVLAIALAEKPAVIIMDVMLPGKNGLGVLRELKTDDRTKTIPVIVITAAVSQQHHATRQESVASGAALFMTKPISPAQLLNEISRLAPVPGPESSQ
jgi:CheY-like chemotaxis protein